MRLTIHTRLHRAWIMHLQCDITRTHRTRELFEHIVIRRVINNIICIINHHLRSRKIVHMVRSANRIENNIPIAITRQPVVGTINNILRISEYWRILRVRTTRPTSGICPIRGNLIPPESIVIKPARLLEADRFGHAIPWWATQVINTSLRMENRLIRILSMYLFECLWEATNGAAIPMHCHTRGVLASERVLINGICIRLHLENVLVKTIDGYILQTITRESWRQIVFDKLCLHLWREIHTLPTTIVTHRFVDWCNRPYIHTLLLPCLDIFSNVISIRLVVLRQQRTTSCYTILTLVVLLVVLHPRRCCPWTCHNAIGLVRLTLFNIPNILHEMVEVVLLILHLWVLSHAKPFLISIKREELHGSITINLSKRILALNREVRRTNLCAHYGEISPLF